MINTKPLAYFLLSSLLYSCSQDNVKNDEKLTNVTYEDFGELITLKGEVVNNDSLGNPHDIYCTDNELIFIDISQDNLVQTYSKDGMTKLSENVHSGTGPNESIICSMLQILDSQILAYDLMSQSLKAYDRNIFVKQDNVKPIKDIHLKEDAAYILKTRSKDYITMSHAHNETLLCLYDSLFNRKDISVAYPYLDETSELDDRALRHHYIHKAYYDEYNDKIVVMYYLADMIDIYDSNLNLLSRVHGPDNYSPKMIFVNNMYAAKIGKTYQCICGGYLTQNYIWALYDGNVFTDEDFPVGFDRIITYDYSGKPKNIYKLDIPILFFCVDEKNRTIYAIANHPDPCIIKFIF